MTKRVPELDGIRGIAIAMVIVWHYFACLESNITVGSLLAYLPKLTRLCYTGVDLFFVLSGFLIGGLLLDNRESRNFIQVFYIRRALRILPAYLLLMLSYFVIRATLHGNRFSWLFQGSMPDLSYLTFTQNIAMGYSKSFGGHFLGVTWSLGVEEQFYLMIPFLLLAFPRKQWVGMFFVLTLVAVVLRLLFPGVHAFVNTPFRMDSLFFGVLTAALVRNQQIRAYLEERRWLPRIAFIMLSIGFMSVALNGGVDILNDRVATLFNVYLAFYYAVLVLLAVLESGAKVTAIFRSPILRYLGLISYGLYLYHEAILGLLHGIIRRSAPSLNTNLGWLVTLLSLAVALAAAVASYFLFERHFLRMGQSHVYEKRLGTRAVTAVEGISHLAE